MHEGDAAARAEHGVEQLGPDVEVLRAEGVGLRLQEMRRGRGFSLVEERRVAHGMGETAGGRHADLVAPHRLAHIGMDHAQAVRDAVPLGVLLADHGVAGGGFDPRQADARIAGEETQGGNTGADAGLEHRFARRTGHGSGEEHRIDARPEALLRLQDAEAAAEEGIFRQAGRYGAGCRFGSVHLANSATSGLAPRYRG